MIKSNQNQNQTGFVNESEPTVSRSKKARQHSRGRRTRLSFELRWNAELYLKTWMNLHLPYWSSCSTTTILGLIFNISVDVYKTVNVIDAFSRVQQFRLSERLPVFLAFVILLWFSSNWRVKSRWRSLNSNKFRLLALKIHNIPQWTHSQPMLACLV